MAKSFFRKAALLTSGILLLSSLNSKAQYSSNELDSKTRSDVPLISLGNSDYNLGLTMGAALGMIVDRPIAHIDNIPNVISYVPAHPDDTYAAGYYNTGSSLEGAAILDIFSLSGGIEAKLKKVHIRSAVSCTLNANGTGNNSTINTDKNDNTINRVNYSHSPDGSSGGAYVFMTSNYSNIIFGSNTEADFPIFYIDKTVFGKVFLGAGIRKYDLYFKTGWDRYSETQTRGYVDYANIVEKSLYTGLDLFCINTGAGSLLEFRAIAGISSYVITPKSPFKFSTNQWSHDNSATFKTGWGYVGGSIRLNVEKFFHKK